MRKVLKWIGIVFGGLIGLLVVAFVILYSISGIRLNKKYSFQTEALVIPSDASTIERGQHWVFVYCTECHGDNLGGTAFFEDPILGRIPATNLTAGNGGIGAIYTDEDWVRALRHGVGTDNTPLLIMPSRDSRNFSDADLADIIAYLKSLPAVDNDLGDPRLTPIARVLLAIGAIKNVINAEIIDHNSIPPVAPQRGVTPEYGGYLARTYGCPSCHGENEAGGKSPDPDAPFAPNITIGGSLSDWTEGGFIKAMRSGVNPGGHAMLNEYMPWKNIGRMTDDELRAVWLYLVSLPPVESTELSE